MEMKGLTSFGGNEVVSDKRQSSNGVLMNNAVSPTTSTPARSQTVDTTQFRQPNMQLPQPSLPPMLPPVNILQFLGNSFERLASLAASFFKGNQRDTVDEEFEDRWEQNEISNPDLFDQHAKVKDTHQSSLGGGNQ
jgi:hypothetical protein